MRCLSTSGRAGPRVGERRHFAEAVCAALRLPCGARSLSRTHKLGPGYEPSNSVRSTPLRGATSGCCAPQRLRGAPPLAHLRPCGTGVCFSRPADAGDGKAGVDGCSGAYATLMQYARTQNSPCGLFCAWRTPWRMQAPGPAVQLGQADVFVGPARRIYAAARLALLRSHRSRPAEREAQGTDAKGGGAASKLLRPSAPDLQHHRQRAHPAATTR